MVNNKFPALLLIDIQKGLDELDYYGGQRNNLNAEKNAATILNFWRKNNWPIFHIKHNSINRNSPLFKGKPGNEIKDIVKPIGDEPIFEKNANSAFIGTDLKSQLDKKRINKLVIVGLTTEHCVSTTVRMAGNFGYETFVVSDATAAFDKVGANGKKYPAELVHEIELANLHGEFATVLETEDLLKKMLNLAHII
ncbi:MAG: cysteine hydrolase family protein [Saprospiraceae bacterium]